MSDLLTKILYFVWVLNSFKCQREIPTSACIRPKPFKTRFNTCANFSEICVKTDDIDCNNLLSACQDCPTSNITVLILQDLLKSNDQLNAVRKDLELKVYNLTRQLNAELKDFELKVNNLDQNIKFLIVIFVVAILVIFLFGLEIRYKVFTKCYESLTGRGKKREYRKVKIKNYEQNKSLYELINNLPQQIQQLIDTQKSIIKFQIENHPPIEMKIEEHERIIKTKRALCSRSPDLDPHDYKIMKLKYNGEILDDNQYLLSFIHTDNKIVQCIIDRSIDHKNFIVLNFFGNFSVPEFIQIETNKTINDLKEMICRSRTRNIENIFLYYKRINLINLQNEKQILNFELKDDDKIEVIEK